jgi:hypothetical protein
VIVSALTAAQQLNAVRPQRLSPYRRRHFQLRQHPRIYIPDI